jgi:hypothetical protein
MYRLFKGQYLVAILVFVTMWIIIWIFSPSKEELMKDNLKLASYEHYNGIVKDKFIDSDYRDYEALIIANQNGIERYLTFNLDKSGAYDYIQIGDSIWKFHNSLDIMVKRDSIIEIFTIDYGLEFND